MTLVINDNDADNLRLTWQVILCACVSIDSVSKKKKKKAALRHTIVLP